MSENHKTKENPEEQLKITQLTEEIEKIKTEKEIFLRALAENENKIKIIQKDAKHEISRTIEKIIIEITPIIYDLHQAQSSLQEEDQEGIILIIKNFQKILNQYGISEIETNIGDEFDHNLHQAISSKEQKDATANTIIQVIQKGYKYKEKIIQPSIVITAC